MGVKQKEKTILPDAEGKIPEEKRVGHWPREENQAAAAGTARAREAEPALGAGPGGEVLTEVLTGTGQAELAPGAHPRGGPGQVWLLRLKGSKAWE